MCKERIFYCARGDVSAHVQRKEVSTQPDNDGAIISSPRGKNNQLLIILITCSVGRIFCRLYKAHVLSSFKELQQLKDYCQEDVAVTAKTFFMIFRPAQKEIWPPDKKPWYMLYFLKCLINGDQLFEIKSVFKLSNNHSWIIKETLADLVAFSMHNCAGISEQYKGARNLVGIGLLYRPARLHRLAESIPQNRFLGSLKLKYTVSGRHQQRGLANRNQPTHKENILYYKILTLSDKFLKTPQL